MKFLTELKSCFAVTVNLTEEASGNWRQMEKPKDNGRGYDDETIKRPLIKEKSSNNGAVKHWQPQLHAISEDLQDSQAEEDGRHVTRRPARTGEMKRPVSVKSRSTAKVVRKTCHRDENWKSSHVIATSMFSPTPFLI